MSLRLIQRFGTSLTVTRPAPGVYVDGKFTQGSPVTFTIIGSEQPMTAEELEKLPEGNQEREKRKLYTTEDLRTQREESGSQVQSADQVEIRGQMFQVIAREPHLYPGRMNIQFFKFIVEAL